MLKSRVNKLEQAFVYIADCILATILLMAMFKSRPKAEFKRQKNIAQSMINWIIDFGIDPVDTRAADVIYGFDGNVESWASSYDVLANMEKYLSENKDKK